MCATFIQQFCISFFKMAEKTFLQYLLSERIADLFRWIARLLSTYICIGIYDSGKTKPSNYLGAANSLFFFTSAILTISCPRAIWYLLHSRTAACTSQSYERIQSRGAHVEILPVSLYGQRDLQQGQSWKKQNIDKEYLATIYSFFDTLEENNNLSGISNL